MDRRRTWWPVNDVRLGLAGRAALGDDRTSAIPREVTGIVPDSGAGWRDPDDDDHEQKERS